VPQVFYFSTEESTFFRIDFQINFSHTAQNFSQIFDYFFEVVTKIITSSKYTKQLFERNFCKICSITRSNVTGALHKPKSILNCHNSFPIENAIFSLFSGRILIFIRFLSRIPRVICKLIEDIVYSGQGIGIFGSNIV